VFGLLSSFWRKPEPKNNITWCGLPQMSKLRFGSPPVVEEDAEIKLITEQRIQKQALAQLRIDQAVTHD